MTDTSSTASVNEYHDEKHIETLIHITEFSKSLVTFYCEEVYKSGQKMNNKNNCCNNKYNNIEMRFDKMTGLNKMKATIMELSIVHNMSKETKLIEFYLNSCWQVYHTKNNTSHKNDSCTTYNTYNSIIKQINDIKDIGIITHTSCIFEQLYKVGIMLFESLETMYDNKSNVPKTRPPESKTIKTFIEDLEIYLSKVIKNYSINILDKEINMCCGSKCHIHEFNNGHDLFQT